jgi:hypothetical protein
MTAQRPATFIREATRTWLDSALDGSLLRDTPQGRLYRARAENGPTPIFARALLDLARRQVRVVSWPGVGGMSPIIDAACAWCGFRDNRRCTSWHTNPGALLTRARTMPCVACGRLTAHDFDPPVLPDEERWRVEGGGPGA